MQKPYIPQYDSHPDAMFTLVSAMIILGESLTLQSAIGCAAILAGVIVGSKFTVCLRK